MRTSALLVTVVIALHCAAIGALFLIQGCGTTGRTRTPAAPAPSMPPTTKEAVSYPPPAEKALAGAELPKTLETTDYTVRSGDTLAGIAKQYGISQSEII
ncbi:MAG: LysM peptidoglycan-binding domain-containing protein, partial [Lentisphaerae bacterium]|nr:LysM peptidoglycan-binding domain-containing protein [Lentisphaerota bacterium]